MLTLQILYNEGYPTRKTEIVDIKIPDLTKFVNEARSVCVMIENQETDGADLANAIVALSGTLDALKKVEGRN